MADVPSGMVTFLFTDIEGSTRLWEEQPEAMKQALVAHDRIVRDAIEDNNGYVFATGGDSFAAAFQRVYDGLLAAVEAQRALTDEEWPDAPIHVRMALHSGEAEERDGDYFGPTLNRAARLMSAGHGGQVLVSQSAFEIIGETAPEELALDDLGDHRLKDLDRAVRIYQLLHPALPAEFAALRTLDYRPNNLPIQLTSFVGREDDIGALVGALSDARLLTVTGVGGSGKTRLALQAAAEVLSDYPGGVWLVELADVVDPGLVPTAVAEELGVAERQGLSLIDSVASTIGDQQLLLLLDNCEHLVDAAAEATAGLLERCPNLRILATSRELLGVPGEVPFAAQSLSLPPAEGNGAVIEGFDAVRLFAERAATAKPGFQVTPSNAADIAQICRRLDGMPLALELAAARVRVMSPEQISARLDDQFSLLTGGARTALPRQRTLQATIEWSYQLLDEDEQAVFQSLSVFVGGFAPEGAEQVAGSDQITGFAVTDLVHRLVDKSLVVAGEEPDGSTRYRLLETIRQFAADELVKSGRATDVRRRHAQAFAALAIEQKQPLQTGEHGVDVLTVEHDNIRAALRWSLDVGDVDTVTDIAATMARYWMLRGLSLEGKDWLLEVLDLIPDTDTPTRASILRFLGWMLYLTGAYARARDEGERALDMARRLDDDASKMGALNTLAVVADATGEYEAERLYLEEGLDLTTDSDHFRRSIFVADLGWAAWKSDDMETARRQFTLAIEEAERGGRTAVEDFLFGLSWVTWVEGASLGPRSWRRKLPLLPTSGESLRRAQDMSLGLRSMHTTAGITPRRRRR
ncbi:MAG: hypothetical protein BMS9Abin07_1840 [Acidimicrobiia bacterium]|nr:MAG: hypothetical protein BMS9Abin07_1840 [Acidimicrobiia bacterium]